MTEAPQFTGTGKDLRCLNSFAVPAWSRKYCIVDSATAAQALWRQDGPAELILGGGSNILLVKQQLESVWHNQVLGRQILRQNNEQLFIRLGAGENWDQAVLWSLQQGAYGLENLSLIPGYCGAAPIQNIGAYGVEVAQFIDQVEVFDQLSGETQRLSAQQCDFAYRHSLFRSPGGTRYLILAIELALPRYHPGDTQLRLQLDYPGIQESLAQQAGIAPALPTPQQVRTAIIQLRRSKLPDPALLGNAGSFFKNPQIDPEQLAPLLRQAPELPYWPQADGRIKLSAAWLIQACHLKAYRQGDAAVHAHHALVLVNHGSATGAELWALAHLVRQRVLTSFGVTLEVEPRVILPAA